jgi:hypothetical protein
MDCKQDKAETNEQLDLEDREIIENALHQMEVLYKSRCVQAPLGANITIREIKED